MIPADLGWMLMDRGWTFRDADTCVAVTRWWVSCGMHWHVALREGIRFVWGEGRRSGQYSDLATIVWQAEQGLPRR